MSGETSSTPTPLESGVGQTTGTRRLNQAQKEALDLSSHCVLTASAGSGKTTVLLNRVVEVLEKNGFIPEQVVAITFTEEAAAQIRRRLQEVILARSRAVSSEETENPWQSLLDTLSYAKITTLHGFCLSLLKEYPFEVGLDPAFKIISAGEQKCWVQNCVRSALRVYSERFHPDLREILNYVAPNELQFLLVELIERRNHRQLEALESSQEMLSEIYFEENSHRLYHSLVWVGLKQFLDRVPSDLLTAGDSYANRCVAQKDLLLGRAKSPENEFVRHFQETLKTKARPSKKWLSWPLYSELRSHWEEVREEYKRFPLQLRPIRGDRVEGSGVHHDRTLELVRRLYQDVLARYQEEKAKDSVVDFDDLLEFAHRLVQNGRVRSTLRRRYPFLLVDEFQDTNHLQWQILLPLIGPESNFFAVGDTKQSIYRFRDADVSVFRKVQRWVEKRGRLLELRENYRATPRLVEFSNRIFRDLFRSRFDYEAVYQEMKPCRPVPPSTKSGATSSVRSFFYDNLPNGFSTEADLTVEAIGLLVKEGFQLGEIAILLRSRTRLKDFERALLRRQVPFVTLAGVSLYNEPETLDLTNLLAFVDDPSFDIALLGILRCPFFNFSDEDIFLLSRLPGVGFWAKLNSEDPVSSSASKMPVHWRFARRKLEEWQNRYQFETLASFLAGAVDETGYREIVSASRRGIQARANLNKFLDLVRRFELGHGPAIRPLLRFLDALRSVDPTDGGSTGEESSTDAVRIYTIHGAKGLEFPAVVMPDLGSPLLTQHRSRFYCESFVVGHERKTFFGMRIRNPDDRHQEWEPPAYRMLHRLKTYRQLAEEKRLLYVAVTRAQDRLLLVGRKNEEESYSNWLLAAGAESMSESVPVSSLSDLAQTWPTPPPGLRTDDLSAKAEPAPRVSMEETPAETASLPRLSPRKRTWTPTEIVLFSKCPYRYYLSYIQGTPEGAPMDWERIQARHALIGSAVHEILENPGAAESQEKLQDLLNSWEQKYASLFAVSEVGSLRERIQESVQRVVTHTLLRRISHSKKVYSERRFHVKRRGLLITGVIDKLFQDDDGGWAVVDFKTGQIDSSDPIEEVRRRGYDLQVELYLWASSQILSTDRLNGFLLLTQSGHAIPIHFDAAVTDRCQRLIDRLPRTVESSEFPRTTEQEHCQSCAFFQQPCPGVASR